MWLRGGNKDVVRGKILKLIWPQKPNKASYFLGVYNTSNTYTVDS